MSLRSVNPATEEVVRTYDTMSDGELDGAIRGAHRAHQRWKRTDFEDRAEPLFEAAERLREDAGDLAEIMAREMGKPLSQGQSEAEKCGWVCEYYADRAEKHLADRPVETDASESYVAYRPLGVVLSIMPWNYPFWQVFRFAAPALMAGNAVLLKHAENVQGCADAIEELLHDAGVPAELFRVLRITKERVPAVLERDEIRAATLTGSTRAGRSVGAEAGSQIKPTVLELGGSDPYLVLEDADLERTVEACVRARLLNSGQSCIAAKRFVVVEEVRDQFVERVAASMKEKTMGGPTEDPDLGPQARGDLRDELHEQVRRSIDAGARCLVGGEVPDRTGYFYPPTVLDGVTPGAPAFEEELFGPVASIITVEDEDEAIHVANDSPFGLGAAVFTEDEARGERIAADELEAGCCFVNAFVRSDPRLPFGGIKASGYGRELSREGIREFVNVKTVYVD